MCWGENELEKLWGDIKNPRQIRSFSLTKQSFGFFLTEPPTQKPERGTLHTPGHCPNLRRFQAQANLFQLQQF